MHLDEGQATIYKVTSSCRDVRPAKCALKVAGVPSRADYSTCVFLEMQRYCSNTKLEQQLLRPTRVTSVEKQSRFVYHLPAFTKEADSLASEGDCEFVQIPVSLAALLAVADVDRDQWYLQGPVIVGPTMTSAQQSFQAHSNFQGKALHIALP